MLRIAMLTIALTSCASSDHEDINEYIRSLGTTDAPKSEEVRSSESAPHEEGDFQCHEVDLQATQQYDRIVALDANSDSLWPGAMVRGDSIANGLLSQITLARKPVDISISLPNLAGAKSVTLENPSLSEYRESLSYLLDSPITGDTPANLYSEIEEVHSQEQLSLAIGVGVDWGAAEIAASFDFDKSEVRSRFMVKYVQNYFTVDVDPPETPKDYFAPSVSLAEVEKTVQEPPTYVSSVSYGRMVIFTFESELSSKEVRSALDFVYNAGVSVDGSVSLNHSEVMSQTKMTAFILGGSGAEAVYAINDLEGLMEFIQNGGNFGANSPASPIAYKLAHVVDNTPARFSLATEYQEKVCERVSQDVLVTLNSMTLQDAGSEGKGKFYGFIQVEGADGTETLFNRSSGNTLHIDEGFTWPQNGIINEKVVRVVPNADGNIRLIIDMRERDTIGGDEDFEAVLDMPFALGWRRTVQIPMSDRGMTLVVSFTVRPI